MDDIYVAALLKRFLIGY